MSLGGGGGQAGARGRGRGRGAGCALFTLDDAPARPLQLLGEPPSGDAPKASATDAGSVEEVDPLDAFMASVTEEAVKPKKPIASGTFQEKPAWEDLEPDDPVVSYCEAYQEGKAKDGSG